MGLERLMLDISPFCVVVCSKVESMAESFPCRDDEE